MPCVAQLLAEGAELVSDEARRDAEVLLCAALDKPRSYLFAWPEADVPSGAVSRYRDWLARRAAGAPIAYLLGQREFWSLPLTVTEATLIPRPDTELLIEQALALELPETVAVADLGTGSGAIALALASERQLWDISAVERSAAALEVARANGERLGLSHIQWLAGSWFEPLAGRRFALIVSNPPYLAEDDPHLQAGDLRFEPRSALASGADGLEDIRRIIGAAPDYLEDGAWLLLEHGYQQGAAVRALLAARGFEQVGSQCDLAGHERVSAGRWARGEGSVAGDCRCSGSEAGTSDAD
jgi:release factor glutamine methyltransferase